MINKIEELNNEFLNIEDLEIINNYSDIKRLSKDFYNYSPILKKKLDDCIADIVIRPKTITSLLEAAKICWHFSIPLTIRGGGTGNYGQAVPLAKGVVVHMSYFNKLEKFYPDTGFVKVQSGCFMGDLKKELELYGRDLRLFPSTWKTASVGGFISGGSGGIGSVKWGFLRDPGNLIGLEAVNLNSNPQLIKLNAEESEPLNHAYGTNGIITSLLIPTEIKQDWYSIIIDCEDFQDAIKIMKILTAAAIELKLGTILEDEIVSKMPVWFKRRKVCHKLLIQSTLGGLKTIEMICKKNKLHLENLGKEDQLDYGILDLVWNHTTLQMRAKDKNWTYLQMLLPLNDEFNLISSLRKKFGKKLLWHLEAVSQQGIPRLAALPVLKWSDEIELNDIMEDCRKLGAIIFNPHVLTVEGGGLGVIDADQVKAKQKFDPRGLFNPGKLEGWAQKENYIN